MSAAALPANQESAVFVLADRLASHDKRDDDRFGTLTTGMGEVKEEVAALTKKVDGIAEDVGFIKGRMEVAPAPAPAPAPHPAQPGAWHVGQGAWTIIGVTLTAAGWLLGWLMVQVYDLQPARIIQAQQHYAASPSAKLP